MTTLFLLPGFDGSGFYFNPLLLHLGNWQTQVVSYTEQPVHSYERLTQYVQTQLPTGEPFVIVAESFSGPIAYRIATQNPPNLRAIIFVATFLRNPRPWLMSIRHAVPWRWIAKIPLPEWLVRHTWMTNAYDEAEYQLILQMVKDAANGLVSQRLETIATLPTPVLQIRQNCLYLQATSDMLVPASALHDFRRLCNSLQVNQIHGGHFLLQNRPQACIEIINEFVNRAGISDKG